ncbi:hypothetical protein SynPROS91_00135 [Synechococcus sp. PROS-9-1]|nr:hypothetical protein SynPROS91_00135 [Synechococcus sp. PROS-9-1]
MRITLSTLVSSPGFFVGLAWGYISFLGELPSVCCPMEWTPFGWVVAQAK